MQIVFQEEFEQATHVDEQVFKDIYRRHFVKLYRLACAVTHSKEAAEEIVHDVLIGLWKKRKVLNGIENLSAYLHISVKNVSLNYLRQQGKHIHADLEMLYDEKGYIAVDPESVLISKEAVDNLNLLINNLPVKCRMVFKLVKEDGLKYKEAAQLLNVSVKTVENQLAIALKKIAAALKR